MSLYIPDSAPSHNCPLLIALHGCSQNSRTLAEQSDWNKLADENGFIVLYPEQRRVNNGSNCFNWFELEDIQPETGELQSIMNMLDYVAENYAVDEKKVFIYGLSAGAAMGVSLMASYPDRFSAGAIFAGGAHKLATTKGQGLKAMLIVVDKTPEEWGAFVDHPDSTEYPQLIVFHGEKDKTVAIENSYELIEQWTNLHQIDTIPDQIIPRFEESAVVDRISYSDSLGKEKIIFFKIKGLGHALPVDPGSGIKQGGQTGVFAKDIDFFSTYHVASAFGLIDF